MGKRKQEVAVLRVFVLVLVLSLGFPLHPAVTTFSVLNMYSLC